MNNERRSLLKMNACNELECSECNKWVNENCILCDSDEIPHKIKNKKKEKGMDLEEFEMRKKLEGVLKTYEGLKNDNKTIEKIQNIGGYSEMVSMFDMIENLNRNSMTVKFQLILEILGFPRKDYGGEPYSDKAKGCGHDHIKELLDINNLYKTTDEVIDMLLQDRDDMLKKMPEWTLYELNRHKELNKQRVD